MFPPPKKGKGLLIIAGKPGDDGPDPLRSPEDPEPSHDEPDADETGGPSDNDADNMVPQYAQEIVSSVPSFAPFLKDLCAMVRGESSEPGESQENDYSGGGY